jgi:hypothetical protein
MERGERQGVWSVDRGEEQGEWRGGAGKGKEESGKGEGGERERGRRRAGKGQEESELHVAARVAPAGSADLLFRALERVVSCRVVYRDTNRRLLVAALVSH